QSALRKQHKRRDPASNPIGPEPHTGSPEPRYRYESVSVDEPATSPADADAEPHEGAANGDGDLAASDEAGSAFPSAEEDEPEESRDWLDLPMLAKLDSMHLLTEWQFQNATRLRTMMKSDDEDATWRIEPIGYDAKSNAYWLIGADRLWIQRALPKPPRYTATISSLKRKRPENKVSTTKSKRPAAKRARLASEDPKSTTTVPVGGGRAAKAQAKLKLDAQAKELAELNRAAGTRAPATRASHGGRTPVAAVRPLGTRVSARLRTGADEDEWQAVPQDWLADEGSKKRSPVKPRPKTGLESDDDSVSDLTELSEEEPEEAMKAVDEEEDAEESVKADAEAQTDPVPDAAGATLVENNREEEQPDGFVEWETICVTLSDWEHIAERFENGTHYTEKALYKVLVKDVVPIITEELREIERKRRLEEAVVHRKRSSRIANKESEKAEARQLARQKAEVVEKKNRAQRLEARLAKEEAERERREAAREQRRKAKEEQEQEEVESAPDEESTDMQVDVVGGIDPSPVHLSQNTYVAPDTRRRNGNATASTSTSGTRTPMGDDWVLNCEICQRSGMNLDDGTPLVCCGVCAQWSHVSCHDRADAKAGRPRRNWDQVEFICRQCQTQRMAVKTSRQYPPQQQQQLHRASIPNPYTSQTTPIAQSMSYSQYGHGPPPQPQPAAHPPRDYPGAYPVAVNGASRYAQQQPTIALAPSQQQMSYPASSSVNYRPQQQSAPPPRISAGPSYNAPIPHQYQVTPNHQHQRQHHNAPNHPRHHQQQSQHLGATNHQHEQQHYPTTYERSPAQPYERSPAQFQHIAPNVNGHRAPVYPQQRPVTQGWNVPPSGHNAHYAPSNGVPRRESERHQYGDGAQWHGGGQQTAAYGYHNGQ
ncbi:hypothetical protein B0H16DRAFT_1606869, partial [Mycena metata]